MCSEALGLSKNFEIISFTSYYHANKYLDSNNDVFIVITNFCTFYWSDFLLSPFVLSEGASNIDCAFPFLKRNLGKYPKTHFILFSSIADDYAQLKSFYNFSNFSFVEDKNHLYLHHTLDKFLLTG